MYVEIGSEAAHFPEEEYINGIFAVRISFIQADLIFCDCPFKVANQRVFSISVAAYTTQLTYSMIMHLKTAVSKKLRHLTLL
jgi:hypothetical protein